MPWTLTDRKPDGRNKIPGVLISEGAWELGPESQIDLIQAPGLSFPVCELWVSNRNLMLS